MARNLRDLRRKMKAIRSTKQVTKAMELVAASKMRRAVQNAQMLRRYALTAARILERLANVHPELHPYLQPRSVHRVLAILLTSDRGLCGSLNTFTFRALQQYLRGLKGVQGFEHVDFVAVGRKGQQFLARGGHSIVAAFPAMSNHPTFRDVLPLVRFATEEFLKGVYDSVVLIYPDFLSALAQEPTVKVLLPFSKTELKEMLTSLLSRRRLTPEEAALNAKRSRLNAPSEYLFEPSPDAILTVVLPKLTELQVYQSVLEQSASEHSARMVAMRNATDNASDLLDDLALTYNRTRQEKITGELSEISAAKAALEQ